MSQVSPRMRTFLAVRLNADAGAYSAAIVKEPEAGSVCASYEEAVSARKSADVTRRSAERTSPPKAMTLTNK
jgi:hypothetical protein